MLLYIGPEDGRIGPLPLYYTEYSYRKSRSTRGVYKVGVTSREAPGDRISLYSSTNYCFLRPRKLTALIMIDLELYQLRTYILFYPTLLPL